MDFQAFEGLQSAVQIKSTLQQIDDRANGRMSAGTGNGVQASLDSLIPTFDQFGNKFAHGLLKNNMTLAIPHNLTTGTLVNYSANGKQAFGLVANRGTGPYIQVLSPAEAKDYQTEHPNSQLYKIPSQYYDSVFISKQPAPTQFLQRMAYHLNQNLPLIIMLAVIAGLLCVIVYFSLS